VLESIPDVVDSSPHATTSCERTKCEEHNIMTNYLERKVRALEHFRRLHHQRALSNAKLHLNLDVVSIDLDITVEEVQGVISELMLLGFVESTNTMNPHMAITDGECAITKDGMIFLHNYETNQAIPEPKTSLSSDIGFDLS
jgi:hypothetical protein